MPFNGSGVFSILNTFVPNTTILSSAVNANFTDIATGLSDCLTRDGQAGMTAAFKAISGALATPSITFTSDATSGLYLSSSGIVGLVSHSLGMLLNTQVFSASSAAVQAGGSGYAVGDSITETGGTAVVQAVFQVATLSGTAVATVTPIMRGFYTAKPTNPVAQGSTSGVGTGCTLNITWNDPSSSDYRAFFSDQAGGLLWQKFGASPFVSALMAKATGLDFATAIGGSSIAAVIGSSFIIPPGGILSPISSTTAPVPATDSTAVTRIYWTPYTSNLCPIYNGVNVVSNATAQIFCDLTAGAQVSGGIYDVYMFLNSGTPTLGFSPSWLAGTSGNVSGGTCARGTGAGGTALTIVDGLKVNAVQQTVNNGATTYTLAVNQGTYLGSIYINSTAGQINCHRTSGQSRVWGLWNAYNRLPVTLQEADPTASWNNAPTSFRISRGDSSNFAMGFCGLAEEIYTAKFTQAISQSASSSTCTGNIGIGVNSSTTITGTEGFAQINAAATVVAIVTNAQANLQNPPSLGINQFSPLEVAPNGTTNNSFRGGVDMQMSVTWRA